MRKRTLNQYIESTPAVCGGKPRIAGRRITVSQIATWHLQLGMSVDEIGEELDLTLASIHAALAFYFEHRQEIDSRSENDQLFVDDMRRKTPSVVAAKLESLAKQVRKRNRPRAKRNVRRPGGSTHATTR